MAQLNDLLVMGQSTLLGPVTTKSLKIIDAPIITLKGDLQGNITFNGSSVESAIYHYRSAINGNNTNTYPYRRIASVSGLTNAYTDKDAIIEIRHRYNGGPCGRIKISLRTNGSNEAIQCSAKWLYRCGMAEDSIIIAYWGMTGQNVYADVFYKITTGWPRAYATQVEGDRSWTMINSTEGTDSANPSEAYNSINGSGTRDAATILHGKSYTSTVTAKDTFLKASVNGTTLTITIP